jgi:hypothetical protein
MNRTSTPSRKTGMTTRWRLAPWLIRSFLLAPALVFTLISVRFIADPVRAAAASGIALESSLGMTNLRSGIGGLFLGSACVTVFCLLSTRRLLAGLSFVATMIGVVLAVRIGSVLVDDTARANLPVLGAEGVFLILSVVGIVIESRRRRLENADAWQKV